jgi:hypothetical protein
LSQSTRAWVLALALPVCAAAQQGETLRDRDPDLEGDKRVTAELQEANFRAGQFYFLSRFRLSEVSVGGPVYVPTGDESSSLSFGVEAPQRLHFVPHRKAVFSVEAVPSYSYLGKTETTTQQGETLREREGQFNYRVRADAHFLLNHLYLNLYTQRGDELRPHVSDINRVATVRHHETGLGTELKYSSKTSALLSLRFGESTYPLDRYQPFGSPDITGESGLLPLQQLDRKEINARVGVLHKTFPRTSLFVATEGSEYEFLSDPRRDSSRRWVGGGFLFDSGRTQMRVEAGPASLDFKEGTATDFEGILGGIKASHLRRRWTYAFSFNRDVGFSIYDRNHFFRSDLRSATLDYQATRRLQLRFSSAWQTDSWDIPVAGVERQDDTMFTTAGFRYGMRRIQTGLDLGWYERNSNIGLEEDSGIRYVVHLSFTP